MEYIDVISIVDEVWLETIKESRFEMKKNMRKIELSTDREQTIKGIIQSLPYEKCLSGNAYINSDYTAGDTFIDIRENLTNYYLNNPIFTKNVRENELPNVIRQDVRQFFLLFHQEIELWKMLTKPKTQYRGGLIELFKSRKDLISMLTGRTDIDIANLINKWAGESLILNPHNRLKKRYAVELKEAGLIKMSVERFRNIL